MPQTKTQIQAILASAGTHPRHRFGQNFMIDQNMVRLMVDELGEAIAPNNRVLEVGPGTGTLTDALLDRGFGVLAVEIDTQLAALLRGRLATRPFELIEGDALTGKHGLCPALAAAIGQSPSLRLCANLPYNIACPLLVELLLAGMQTLVFTVQKEVADRLAAAPGGDDYGALSVVVQALAGVQVLRTIPPQAFWPMPRVDSALVRIDAAGLPSPHARDFAAFVGKLFSRRRKMLRRSLQEWTPTPASLLTPLSLDEQQRVEELTPQALLQLHAAIARPGQPR